MPLQITTDIILFDLDGTLVDSTASVEKSWNDYHEQYGIDISDLFHKSHGARTVDTFGKYFPELVIDGSTAKAVAKFEETISVVNGHLATPIKGAIELLAALNQCPDEKWAICTSGTSMLAHGWFKTVLPVKEPKIFVTADDVTFGKPNPEPYVKGRELVTKNWANKDHIKTVVFEDAPAGIKAGKAAGAVVVGILSSFDDPKILSDAGADYIIKDLTAVKVISNDKQGIVLEIDQ